jgi:hypothetical protein
MIYPNTTSSYSFMLIVPVLLLWANREEIPIVDWGIVAFITLICVLIGHWSYIFVANILLWLALALFSTWTIIKQKYYPEGLFQSA